MPNESTGHDNMAELNDDLSLLGQDDNTPVDKKEGEDSPVPETPETPEGEAETPEKDEETPDKDGEKTDEKDDEAGVTDRHSRPTITQIKTKYPNFFKDFPDMRHMLFREGEYSNIFHTVDQAREAAEHAEDFERLSDLVTSGKKEDFSSFLKGISEGGPKILTNMAANFLPSLYEMNKDMYFKVTSPIAESFLRNAYRAATKNGNENLKNAALVLSEWGFEDTGYATGDKKSPPIETDESSKDPELSREKQEFYQQKYNDTRGYVDSNASNRIRLDIKKSFDPNGVFNDFTANLLVRQVMEEIGRTLEADKQHMAAMNYLWKQAHRAGFAGDWKDRLLSTYLSRARAIMPGIRSRIRSEALKGQERIQEDRGRTADRSAGRKEVGGSGPNGAGKTRTASSGEIDWNRTSDMDILNDKVTTKKRG